MGAQYAPDATGVASAGDVNCTRASFLRVETSRPHQPPMMRRRLPRLPALAALAAILAAVPAAAQQTAKPVLHGRHWMAITGKPLAATAGAMTF